MSVRRGEWEAEALHRHQRVGDACTARHDNKQPSPSLSVTAPLRWVRWAYGQQVSGAEPSTLCCYAPSSGPNSALLLTGLRTSPAFRTAVQSRGQNHSCCGRDTIRAPRAHRITGHARAPRNPPLACNLTRPCRPSDGPATCHDWVRKCTIGPAPHSVTHGFHAISRPGARPAKPLSSTLRVGNLHLGV